MIKHLSNTFALLYILSNQLLIAQVGELRDSGAFDQACQRGIGPWYFASNYANYEGAIPYDIIDLNSKKVSLIDRDGVVCFCEGESEFSGLVTANDVTLYGNGAARTVKVSPSIDNYFNLIFLKDDDLFRFTRYYPFDLKDEGLGISNGKKNLELSIKNITFTNSLSRSQSENWLQKYSPIAKDLRDQVIENVNCLNDQLESSSNSDNEAIRQECFDDNQGMIPSVFEFSKSSIQGNRANASLMLENVIFLEIDNDNLLEFFSEEGVATFENIQLVQNNTLGGLQIAGIRNLELSNVKADRNYNTTFDFIKNQNVSLSNVLIENSRSLSGLIMMGNFNQSLSKIKINENELFLLIAHSHDIFAPTIIGEGQLSINDFEVSDSQVHTIWFSNQKLKADNVFFNNNKWYAPFMFMASEKKPFKFNRLGFENNRGGVEESDAMKFRMGGGDHFTLSINGSGSLNNFTFGGNQISVPIMLHSSKMIFNRSYFAENNILEGNDTYKSLIVQVGNIEYNNAQFLNNNFQWSSASPRFQGQKIIIIPRFLYYENIENTYSMLREDEPLYRLLANHKISMRNVRMDHPGDVASIFAINANTLQDWPQTGDAEGINPSVFQLGEESGEYSMYKFYETDNIECAFVDDVYGCQ
tara:strand:+ start:125 stop:2053 length:1929 start_codon:yes stop_codon:yes gene_type:complete